MSAPEEIEGSLSHLLGTHNVSIGTKTDPLTKFWKTREMGEARA